MGYDYNSHQRIDEDYTPRRGSRPWRLLHAMRDKRPRTYRQICEELGLKRYMYQETNWSSCALRSPSMRFTGGPGLMEYLQKRNLLEVLPRDQRKAHHRHYRLTGLARKAMGGDVAAQRSIQRTLRQFQRVISGFERCTCSCARLVLRYYEQPGLSCSLPKCGIHIRLC